MIETIEDNISDRLSDEFEPVNQPLKSTVQT
jgi:hypothetical protein